MSSNIRAPPHLPSIKEAKKSVANTGPAGQQAPQPKSFSPRYESSGEQESNQNPVSIEIKKEIGKPPGPGTGVQKGQKEDQPQKPNPMMMLAAKVRVLEDALEQADHAVHMFQDCIEQNEIEDQRILDQIARYQEIREIANNEDSITTEMQQFAEEGEYGQQAARGRQGYRNIPGRAGANSLGAGLRKQTAQKQKLMQQLYPTGKNLLPTDLKKKQQQARSQSPSSQDQQKPKRKKKDKSLVMSTAQLSMSDLQSVEEFRHFLLRNDSQFSEYINSPLMLSLFDSHLMREGMISIMAQVLGNGQTKDSFFLMARQAMQDTLSLFYITRNIAFNNSLEFYLPRLVEMLSDLLDVERCSIFLYDGLKDTLFCKVITGRLREPISFKRESNNVMSQVFNTGTPKHYRKVQDPAYAKELSEYLEINGRLHQVIKNALFVPIRLGNHAIGVFEVANKKGQQDFTTNDYAMLAQVSEEIASGLISHEMKYNIRKEFDDEVRYFKGLLNQSYQSFFVPMAQEIITMMTRVTGADKVVMYMHNQDIDMLYSLSMTKGGDANEPPQQFGQFGINSIRMKSTLGIAGAAFQSGQICDDMEAVAPEEKDPAKLKFTGEIKQIISVPVLDRQNGIPVAAISLYNPKKYDNEMLMDIAQLISQAIFSLDSMQGTLANNDLLQSSFDLVNDGVVFLNTAQEVTKLNKSAEILLNISSSGTVGKQISDLLMSSGAGHLMMTIKELSSKPYSTLENTKKYQIFFTS